MRCIDIPVFLSYVAFVTLLFGFPYIYLSARRLGRALEEHENVRKAAIDFALKTVLAGAVAAGALYVLGIVPILPC